VAAAEEFAIFRGGIALEGGAPIAPPGFTVGMVGVQGHTGLQFGAWSYQFGPSLDFSFGRYRELILSVGLMLEYMPYVTDWRETLTFGFGPEIGAFKARVGPPPIDSENELFVGLKLHAGFNVVLDKLPWELKHAKALRVGLEIHALGYGNPDRFASPPGAEHKIGPLFWAMLVVGYEKLGL
jgi:hypothetical protein